ncbi:hypothetical protein GCM10020331_066520 [Ectobacillus funiculus]
MKKNLNRYLDRVEQKAADMQLRFSYEPVSRKANKEAHQLASQALQGIVIDSHAAVEE